MCYYMCSPCVDRLLCGCCVKNLLRYWPRSPYLYLYVLVILISKLLTSSHLDLLRKYLEADSEDSKCINGDCYMVRGVYRLYAGASLFHIVLAAIHAVALCSPGMTQVAAIIHDGMWAVKIPAWGALIYLLAEISNQAIELVGNHLFTICAMVFVIFQSVISLDFAYGVCEKIGDKYDRGPSALWSIVVSVGTLGTIILELVVSILALIMASRYSCVEYEWVIITNLMLCSAVTALSIMRRVQEASRHAGLTLAAIITLYSTYTMFVALLSNNSYPCAAFDKSTNISLPLTWVVTFVYLLHTTIYSSRMSHLIKSSQDGYSSLLREETEEPYSSRTAMSFFFMDTECEDYSEVDNDTIFSYLFFHIVFACSLMYTAKFFTNWSLITHEGNNIYISPTNLSFYLRIGAAWGTIAMLSWTLMAPLILPDTFP